MTTKRTARMRGIQRYKNQLPSARLMEIKTKKRPVKSSQTEFSITKFPTLQQFALCENNSEG